MKLSSSHSGVVGHLLIAFTLGLPTALIVPFSIMPTPTWWRPEIPLALLLLAMLLSILRDPQVRARKVSSNRTALSIGMAILLTGTIEVLALVGAYQPAAQTSTSTLSGVLWYLGRALVPFVLGLVAAFTAGSDGTARLALGAALVSWLGACVLNLIATVYDVSGPTPPDGCPVVGAADRNCGHAHRIRYCRARRRARLAPTEGSVQPSLAAAGLKTGHRTAATMAYQLEKKVHAVYWQRTHR